MPLCIFQESLEQQKSNWQQQEIMNIKLKMYNQTTILNILTINRNAIGTTETDRDANCNKNTSITQDTGSDQSYTNTRQEAGRLGGCNTHTSINTYSAYMSMVNNNEIKHFLPGLNQDNDRGASSKTTT